MAAGAWVVVNSVGERMGNAEFNFDTDAFVVKLLANTSNISATSDDATAVTGELSTANGYTSGGTSVTPGWTRSSNVSTFDISDPAFTALGGSIVARWAMLVDTTATPDRVIAYMLLDSTPADVTTTTGNTLTIVINASGIFTLTS